ncbi:MAG: Na(+)-translocating NADH-quinone reductase subunit C [Gammaproteobacteria bacterium]
MKDSVTKTLFVSFVVCFICSLVVSYSAVSLRDAQENNKLNDKRSKILQAAGIFNSSTPVEEQFKQLEQKFIRFSDGILVDEVEGLDISSYDPVEFSKKSGLSKPVNPEEDIAVIKSQEHYGKIYILKNQDQSINKVVLPVRGYGLWGTLYGFISLGPDLNTIQGLEFYEHKETPGLGGEVDNPNWKNIWKGKKIYDISSLVSIEVVKGKTSADDKNIAYKVDGLSGATLTSRGVTNMMHYWFGDNGYKSALEKLSNGS